MSTPFYDLASLVVVPSGYKASKVYAQKPLTTDGQLTFSRASTATRVNSAGLIETVSSNVPRLDYLGSTCPKLLLEPQRTNALTYSSELDNAAWDTKDQVSVTANATTAPDGTNTADKLVENTANDQHRIYRTGGGSNATFSFFAKAAERSWVSVLSNNGTFTYFNIGNGTLGTVAATSTATITPYANGWYRCTVYNTHGSFGSLIQLTTGNNVTSYLGDGTSGAYIWGCQLEASSTYATSLIPTTTAAVTRLEDACSKTGISSLIGQTEGTLFVEFFYNEQNNTPNGSDKSVCRLKTGAGYTDEICITYYGDEGGSYGKTIQAFIVVGGASQAALKTTQTMVSGYYKVAVAYKANDFTMAVNGAIVSTDNSGSVPTCADLTFNESTRVQSDSSPKQALLFKTRLTNAQLAELTTL